jgi:hypothetical protein
MSVFALGYFETIKALYNKSVIFKKVLMTGKASLINPIRSIAIITDTNAAEIAYIRSANETMFVA